MKMTDTNYRTISAIFTAAEVRDMLFKQVTEKAGIVSIRPSELDSLTHTVNEDGSAEIFVRLKVIGATPK